MNKMKLADPKVQTGYSANQCPTQSSPIPDQCEKTARNVLATGVWVYYTRENLTACQQDVFALLVPSCW
jgi:hypothetical protein